LRIYDEDATLRHIPCIDVNNFFFFWVAPFTALTPLLYETTSIVSLTSLLGLLLFIPAARREDGPWYPAFLLPVAVLALGIVSYMLYPEDRHFLSDPVSGREGIWSVSSHCLHRRPWLSSPRSLNA